MQQHSPQTIDEKISALVPEIDAGLRAELQQTLCTLRDAGNPTGVLLTMSRLGLWLTGEILSRAGRKRPDNLYDCIALCSHGDARKSIRGLEILPDEMASYLHTIRKLSNIADHRVEKIKPAIGDAETTLSMFLRVVEWFYCEFQSGAQLASIYSAEALQPVTLQAELNRLRHELNEWEQRRLESKRQAIVGLRFSDVSDFFKDREDKIADLRRLLGNKTAKLICIVGRGGIGKTALLSKICAEIECGELCLSEASAQMGADGILYLSCRGTDKPTLGRLFDGELGVGKWLGSPHAEELMDCWRDTSRSLADKARFLLSKLRDGCYLLVLDNLEDALAPDNTFADPELSAFIDLCLTTPHALRLLATSRERVVVGGQVVRAARTVPLDSGLPDEDAIELLRDLDPEGYLGLRDAPDELLQSATQRCYGVPRALETIAGILSSDPTLALTDLLTNETLFNEQVVENLIAEHYRRINEEQRRVLEALAIYNKSVPSIAVRYLLEPFFSNINVDGCLRDLMHSYFITFHRARETYELHPLDQQHAYAGIPGEGGYNKVSCHRRAAAFYAEHCKPLSEWRTFADLQPQREQFNHLISGRDHEGACKLLNEIDEHLIAWGYYAEIYQMRSQLVEYLSDHWGSTNRVALAECLYQGLDKWDEALQQVQKVEESFSEHQNESVLAEAMQIHAHILFERGEFESAFKMALENLKRYERIGSPVQVANALNSLGVFVDAVGKWQEALGYYDRAQKIFEEVKIPHELGRVLINRSVAEFFINGPAMALSVCQRGISLCPEQERPQELAYGLLNMAIYYLAEANIEQAESLLEQCAAWAEKESWYSLSLRETQVTLFQFQGKNSEALELLNEVVEPFQNLEDNWGEVDCNITRGFILRDMGRGGEAFEAWEAAFSGAQARGYYLGTRMSSYLLSSSSKTNLPPDTEGWAQEFEKLFLPHFQMLFMPCYVLSLRAKSITR
jgi:tetratricopeptide (TPR) repeat protein